MGKPAISETPQITTARRIQDRGQGKMTEQSKMWAIVECSRGKEKQCEALLERLGHPDGWHPVKAKDVRTRGSTRRKTGQQARRVYSAWVPGYIFVPDTDLRQHKLNGWHGQLWLRVLAPEGRPYLITDTQMAEMRDIPGRIREIVDEAARLEQERWEAARPRVGLRAVVNMDGPFNQQEGVVTEIDGKGSAVISMGTIPLKIPERNLERVVA